MLGIESGSKDSYVMNVEEETSSLASSIFTLTNGVVGLRPHVPKAGARVGRHQLLLNKVYACGIGVGREIVSLPAPRLLGFFDVQTGEFARPGKQAGSLKLCPDTGVVSSFEYLEFSDCTVEVEIQQFLLWQNVSSMAHVVGVRLVTGVVNNKVVRVEYGVDDLAVNEYLGSVSSLMARHYRLADCETRGDGFRIVALTSGNRVVYTVRGVECLKSDRQMFVSSREGSCSLSVFLEIDNSESRQVRFVSHIHIGEQEEPSPMLAFCCLDALHKTFWSSLWKKYPIEIKAPGHPVEIGFKYAIYQMIQHGGCLPDLGVSMQPARGLTSTYHSGSVFFDTDLHKCIFWIWNDPQVARAIINYRFAGLEAAIAFANKSGFAGARYPEAANDLGVENGPRYILSYPKPGTRREWSVDEVLHVSADVAYALFIYWKATRDKVYMRECGGPIVLECARFAASVFTWSEEKKAYVINSVMGPDEYHYHVSNSFFTNYMLRWCLKFAVRLSDEAGALHVSESERSKWGEVSDNVFLPWMTVGGVSIPEEFEGYSRLPDVKLRQRVVEGVQFLDDGERSAADGLENFSSKLVKQADVILLMSLFPDDFSLDIKIAAFDFYEPRTTHESSLSYGPHAVVAADINKIERSAEFISRGSRYDLDFSPATNYSNGVHLSAYAGAWQGVVQGLAGLRIRENCLTLSPKLPEGWEEYRFRLCFRGCLLKVVVKGDGLATVTCDEGVVDVTRTTEGDLLVEVENDAG